MSHLSCRDLSWYASGRAIVDAVDLDIERGQFVGLIGPNGSGKTSLLSLLAGLRKPSAGVIHLNGQSIARISRRTFAQELAFVSQHNHALERIDVAYVVALGRTPYLSALSPRSERDDELVAHCLDQVGLAGFEERKWADLSGGEQQRVQLARALAQEPSILLLDEPTNHLDIHHQLNLLDLVCRLDLTIVAALHDLNHAAMFCDHVVMLQDGRVKVEGDAQSVLTSHRLREVFRVDSLIEQKSDTACHIRYQRPGKVCVA